MFQYRVCGLSVESDFALPEMVQESGKNSSPDVRIRHGAVPAALEGCRHSGPIWQISDRAFLLIVPGVARFLATDGCDVVIERQSPATDADAAPFLMGTVVGALLHQRGQLVLHASTVMVQGRGVMLCGASGAGKSTLAAALCQAGCTFVSDDLTAIRFDGDGAPVALPDGRRHRLWLDAAGRLGLADRLGPPVRPHIRKYHVDPLGDRPPGHGQPDSVQLGTIIVLREAQQLQQPELTVLEPADAAALLCGEIYRPILARRLGRDADLFRQIALLLGRLRVFRLDRTMDFATLDDTVAAILAQCSRTSGDGADLSGAAG